VSCWQQRNWQLAGAVLLVLSFVRSASGQDIFSPPADQRPPILEQVGIEQHLNQQVPPELQFRDESGTPVTLGQYFSPRPIILNLVYYSCPMLCGEVLNGLTSALRTMSLTVGKDFDVITISFDPRETSQMAAEKKEIYLKQYHRAGAEQNWHFLTGGKESIAALTRAVGFQYKYDRKASQFAHATAIMLLTPQGRISQYYYGIEYAPRDLRLGLVQASNNQIGTLIDQAMLYCFHYDPATGKYSAIITRVMRIAALITILALGTFLLVMFRLGPKNRALGRAA
jgi:protein SCO1/2